MLINRRWFVLSTPVLAAAALTPLSHVPARSEPSIFPTGVPVALGFGPESGSRVLEIDPVTKEIVWEYGATDTGQPAWTFNTSFIGAVRRLPNGNTFIDKGMTGRFFQVTPAGEIVWEYVSPYVGKAPLGPGGRKLLANWIYRGQPVPYDWAPAGTPHS